MRNDSELSRKSPDRLNGGDRGLSDLYHTRHTIKVCQHNVPSLIMAASTLNTGAFNPGLQGFHVSGDLLGMKLGVTFYSPLISFSSAYP